MEAEVKVAPGTRADIEGVLGVQAASPEAARWSRNDYENFLAESGCLFLVGRAGGVIGFVAARVVADELEILNIAVEPGRRGRGIGAWLLREVLAEARRRGARSAWLEVRHSNRRALTFYHSFGFREAYRRSRFYQAPEEDAVVYRRALAPPASA